MNGIFYEFQTQEDIVVSNKASIDDDLSEESIEFDETSDIVDEIYD